MEIRVQSVFALICILMSPSCLAESIPIGLSLSFENQEIRDGKLSFTIKNHHSDSIKIQVFDSKAQVLNVRFPSFESSFGGKDFTRMPVYFCGTGAGQFFDINSAAKLPVLIDVTPALKETDKLYRISLNLDGKWCLKSQVFKINTIAKKHYAVTVNSESTCLKIIPQQASQLARRMPANGKDKNSNDASPQ